MHSCWELMFVLIIHLKQFSFANFPWNLGNEVTGATCQCSPFAGLLHRKRADFCHSGIRESWQIASISKKFKGRTVSFSILLHFCILDINYVDERRKAKTFTVFGRKRDRNIKWLKLTIQTVQRRKFFP